MPDDETLAEFDRLTQLLSQHVVKFADEEIPDEMLSARPHVACTPRISSPR